MSLRNDARRTGGPRRVWFIVILIAGALAVGVTVGAARAARTGAAGAPAGAGGASPQGGGAAVVHQVSAAAQRAALAYWTPARMKAAQAEGLPQTARGASSRVVRPPRGIPKAIHFDGVPTTGTLFTTTVSGKKAQSHFCSASVVDSTAGDLVLTAAHCVYSTKFATDIEYVPEYHNGVMPYGGWAVGKIFVAAGWSWKNRHNPDLDFAFLVVSPLKGRKIQSVTGGLTLGFTRWYRETIEVIGYNDPDSAPIRCLTKSFPLHPGQMEFYCHGFWTGTSGGPWIIGYNVKRGTGTVFGVIGGYEQGGDYEWVSYSAYFGPQARVLFGQAERAATPRPSPSPSPTRTPSPTASPKPSPTASPTATPTASPTGTATASPTGTATGTPTGTQAGLQDLRAVHLAERVGEQFKARAVRVAQVCRRPALFRVLGSGGVQLAAQVLPFPPGDRDRDVVQAAEHLRVRADVQAGKVEERQQSAVPHIEEEVTGALTPARRCCPPPEPVVAGVAPGTVAGTHTTSEATRTGTGALFRRGP